jgi:hypothetical protein
VRLWLWLRRHILPSHPFDGDLTEFQFEGVVYHRQDGFGAMVPARAALTSAAGQISVSEKIAKSHNSPNAGIAA